jgi:hypothetical protein
MNKKILLPVILVPFLFFFATAFLSPPEEVKYESSIAPLPLPGQRAPEFKLTAVLGEEIKTVALSNYRGKWVYLTFFPAAFTFV